MKHQVDQPEQPHSFTCNGNQGTHGSWRGMERGRPKEKKREKGHSSSWLTRISTLVTSYTPNFIWNAEWYHWCIPLCLLPALSALQRRAAAETLVTTRPLFTWELVCCWPLWQLLAGREEARVRGQWAQLSHHGTAMHSSHSHPPICPSPVTQQQRITPGWAKSNKRALAIKPAWPPLHLKVGISLTSDLCRPIPPSIFGGPPPPSCCASSISGYNLHPTPLPAVGHCLAWSTYSQSPPSLFAFSL